MDSADPSTGRKVGDIASETGMTVRTLHYYEEIGLLSPDGRTPAGHRIYGDRAVEQIYKIAALRQLGLPLDELRSTLDQEADLAGIIGHHLATVQAQLDAQTRLRSKLSALVSSLETTTATTGDLLRVLEDMTMLAPTVDSRIAIPPRLRSRTRRHHPLRTGRSTLRLPRIRRHRPRRPPLVVHETPGSLILIAVERLWADELQKFREISGQPLNPRRCGWRWMIGDLLEACATSKHSVCS